MAQLVLAGGLMPKEAAMLVIVITNFVAPWPRDDRGCAYLPFYLRVHFTHGFSQPLSHSAGSPAMNLSH